MTEFESFLSGKKIDPEKFRKKEKELYDEFESLFMQIHPNSFVAQKLFLINTIRRQFPLKVSAEDKSKSVKKVIKPKITPRIKKL